MERYTVIHRGMPREMVLLQGTGCRWAHCRFCNYYHDTSADPYQTNRIPLSRITGQYGVLDVINSGSAPELDEDTLELIAETVKDKKIHTIWLEAHYMYRKQLKEFAGRFNPATVKFRCGIESFDPSLRNLWHKGIPDSVTPEDVADYFQGVCLLCCTRGERKERILQDIRTAQEHFEYFSINLFCNNGTEIHRDEGLAEWFIKEIYPSIKDEPGIDILLENTDLGVG